jgi:hypothetical protein
MIATFLTYCYAKYQNEPCILMGLQENECSVEAIICTITDGAIQIVALDQVKIDPDRLKDLRKL